MEARQNIDCGLRYVAHIPKGIEGEESGQHNVEAEQIECLVVAVPHAVVDPLHRVGRKNPRYHSYPLKKKTAISAQPKSESQR
jgi:hypothetical protein